MCSQYGDVTSGAKMIDCLLLTMSFPFASNTLAIKVSGCFCNVPLEICAVTSSVACFLLTLVCSHATPGEAWSVSVKFSSLVSIKCTGRYNPPYTEKSPLNGAMSGCHALLTRTASKFVPLSDNCFVISKQNA